MLPALIAVTRGHERTVIARASRRPIRSPSSLLVSFTSTPSRRQFLSSNPTSSSPAAAMEAGSSTPLPAPAVAQEVTDAKMAPKEKEVKLPSRPAAVQLKVPKGTRDWSGADMHVREHLFKTMNDIFKSHGGTPLDTPVFELKEILAGKYGEDSRLIYDLEDQGGELCSLRYDLTVPFARWLAMTGTQQVKRYQIAKVYRRDQPAIARGRFREFHQCDFDIAGVYDAMIPDSEILSIIVEVFEALQLDITIKLNHRKILDGLFTVAGVPAEKIRPISSAVDKLDKMPWAEVKKEMVEEKGLAEEVADQIGVYVQNKGTITEMIEYIQADAKLSADENIQAGLKDMGLLAKYLKAMEIDTKVSFDLSLARGLDYYTSLIFEVINQPPKETGDKKKSRKDDPASQVGSIAAGGRYDNLVGMYGKKQIPCVGISFGVDRIFTILAARNKKKEGARPVELDVYVMAAGSNSLLEERMAITRQLWKAGLRAEFQPKVKVKMAQQFKNAEGVPLGVILGEDEWAKGQVRLKVLNQGKDAEKDDGKLVEKDNIVAEVKKLLV
ncbi:histidyl-tRNA synthetase [Apodospora peruviana]|uniref:Histidine--tRNA ligase, mitochondrial n=1 Tax=Apodospora peruviana TaxID=516989 RepID=A0AAE0HU58_9PEZI|nr:histidyl-tRNA synthetase [Apodospora peruviana]